ncbi:MAG: DUF3486 family protein [Boseongicola sp. SB0673_bin_14]|nr:DUF3486 family protein [Boseongicola sp. SB0667_bin_21]MYI68200.1 DUF3486 family protein [Boseongicola sp. SB0673_bin_14]
MKSSAFDRHFSPADQAKLAAWLDQNPAMSVDDFHTLLAERGLKVSRATAHTEKQKLEKLGNRMRRGRQWGQYIQESMAGQDVSQTTRAMIEMVKTLGFELVESLIDAEDDRLDTGSLRDLAGAIDALTLAERRNQDYLAEVRREAKEEAEQEAANVAESLGISREKFFAGWRDFVSTPQQGR